MLLQPSNLTIINATSAAVNVTATSSSENILLQKQLRTAVLDGNIKGVKKCAKLGADVNTPDNNGATPVLIAAQKRRVDVIGALAELGADVNTPDHDGFTPVCSAALKGHVDAIRVLAEFKANINTTDNNGFTPVSMVLLWKVSLLTPPVFNEATIVTPTPMSCIFTIAVLICASAKATTEDRRIDFGIRVISCQKSKIAYGQRK
jgi:hypothetical protein